MLTDKQKQLIKNLTNVKSLAKTRTEYNAYQQMLTRIRKLGMGAINDLLFLTEELSDEELKKIFTEEFVECLLKIILKSTSIKPLKRPVGSLTLDASTGQMNRVYTQEEVEKLKKTEEHDALLNHLIRVLQKEIMGEHDLKAQEELMEKYGSPSMIQAELLKLTYVNNESLWKESLFDGFLKSKSLQDDYELYKEEWLREGLKESGWSKERIDDYMRRHRKRKPSTPYPNVLEKYCYRS